MKKIDKLVITSFLGPYVLSFFVAEFVLLMQFLWKYIDDILGKGFSMLELLELMFYYGVTIISMSVPLTILISSVMVFGNMSERYELSSMKSAGVSLLRVMKSAIYLSVFTAAFSIFSSNYLKPKANFKFQTTFNAIRKAKSSLAIEEGIFNKDFEGYVIRVNKKHDDGIRIEDVLLYDHTNSDRSKTNVVTADHGEMYTTDNGRYFIMKLYDGMQFREMSNKLRKSDKKKSYPLMRTYFESYTKVFDMSEFDFDSESLNINPNKADMLNTFQILKAVDSLQHDIRGQYAKMENDFNDVVNIEVDSAFIKKETTKKPDIIGLDKIPEPSKVKTKGSNVKNKKNNDKAFIEKVKKKALRSSKATKKKIQSVIKEKVYQQKDSIDLAICSTFMQTIREDKLDEILNRSLIAATASRDKTNTSQSRIKHLNKSRNKYILRLNQQYSWALVCIIFLFIGAPLGSIIRKGGYGYPLLFAILFYMIFLIVAIMGEKLNKSNSMDPVTAAWLPCIILLPISIYLTTKALKDSKFIGLTQNIENLISYIRSKRD